ncbi:MAG: T9SS type A sorting domain-containing protein [Prevotellaceae bacterium]|jgi:pectinesterase|nr:T9SS type A sorting domain-containing protein [Prevotellaceae bacterium]
MKKISLFITALLVSCFVSSQIPARATWSCVGNTDSEIVGALSDGNYELAGLQFKAYDGPDGCLSVQSVDNTDWHTAEDAGKYIQFSVGPIEGGSFTVTEISGWFCGKGGGEMRANFYYSTDPDFIQRTKIPYLENEAIGRDNTTGLQQMVEEVDNLLVESGGKIYFRIYPYYKNVSTGKQICLKDIIIKGTTPGELVIELPALATPTAATYISTNSAKTSSGILDNGGGSISACGFVWSTEEMPTIYLESKTVDTDTKNGNFAVQLQELETNATYYVRSYATNEAGTGYSEQMFFTTLSQLSLPTVTTGAVSGITNTGFAINNCNVSDWGGAEVTERGVVYSASENPTVSDFKSVKGSDIGTFNGYAGNLEPQQTYFARAFATNSVGTSYGEQVSATTLASQPQVEKTVSKYGDGDYTTIQDAFDAVPTNYLGNYIIRVKPGIYRERPTLAQNKNKVYLVGYWKDSVAHTVIVDSIAAGMDNGSGSTWGTSNSQTVAVFGNDFTAAYITFQNLYKNATIDPLQAKQAVALKTQGDRQAFYHCNILGYQDTYLGNSIGRAYFKECYIEGNVDFIFGRQTCVFDNCTTYANRKNSVIVAPSTEATTAYGMVFLDCDLRSLPSGELDFNDDAMTSFHFGRPWQARPKAAFIRCNAPNTLNPQGWTTMTGGLNPVFVEYGTIGEGGADLSQRANGGIVISESEAALFTVGNVFKHVTDPSFLFDWMPEAKLEEGLSFDVIPAEIPSVDSNNQFFQIFPNPVTAKLKIVSKDLSIGTCEVEIYDISGKIVITSEFSGDSHTIDVSCLTSGVYFLKAGNIVKKFVKE